MNAIEFNQLLIDLDACADARAWAKGKDLKTVWNTCDRGDWLLWLCGRMAGKKGWPTQKQVVLAACDCAETALKYVPEGDNRPKNAIRTARAGARGRATLAQVRDARHAATAYAAEAATIAAACAARAAAYAAYAAAYADARTSAETSKELAEIVRSRLSPKAVR